MGTYGLRVPASRVGVRAGCAGRLAPRAPRTVRTWYAYQPRPYRTYRAPYVPRTVRTAHRAYRAPRSPWPPRCSSCVPLRPPSYCRCFPLAGAAARRSACTLTRVEMTAALGSGSAPRPLLPQPWARASPLLLGSGPSLFEATRQPSSGRPKAEDLRPNPLTATPPPRASSSALRHARARRCSRGWPRHRTGWPPSAPTAPLAASRRPTTRASTPRCRPG